MIKKLIIIFFILSIFLFLAVFLVPKEYTSIKVNLTSEEEINVSFDEYSEFSAPFTLSILNRNQTFISLIFKEENVSYYIFSPENWRNFTSTYIFYGNTSTTIQIKNHSVISIVFDNKQRIPRNFSVIVHQYSTFEGIGLKNEFEMQILFTLACILLIISLVLTIFLRLRKGSFRQVNLNY